MEPYYSDGLVTLHHGRALEVLRQMAADSVDVVVTSPPYNMGLTPGGNGRGLYRASTNSKGSRFREGYDGENDDAMPHEEYVELRRAELAEMYRVARLGVFYNHRPRVIHGVLADPLDGDYGGLEPRQRIVLNRGTGIDVSLRQFCTRGEYLLLFAKPDFTLIDHAASGMGDVWDVPVVTGSNHPAPFPLVVPARCIAATGAASVLDPFVGSGTTLRAAVDAGIKGIGIEKHEPYCQMTAARVGSWRHSVAGDDGSLFGGAA